MRVRRGFSLIEILIALAIIGIISALIFPMLQNMQGGRERRAFISQFESLVQTALQQALMTRDVHRIMVDLKTRRISLEREETREGAPSQFVPLKEIPAAFTFASSIQIKQFIVEDFDEMQRFSGQKIATLWFFVVPDGLVQRVVINAFDKERTDETGKSTPFSLVVNPFTGQVRIYNEFQK